VIVVGIFDQDVSARTSKRYPELYQAGIQNLFFKWRVIILWLISATYQSLIFFYFPVTAAQSPQNYSARMLGVWDVSTLAYTCILTTVNLRLMMASSSLTKWHLVGVGGSIGGWFIFVFIYSGIQVSFIQENIYWVMFTLLGTWYFWFLLLLVPIIALSGDLLVLFLQRWLYPYDFQILQEESRKLGRDDTEGRPELMAMLDSQEPSLEDRRRIQMAQLPKERSKHTGFSFDSPGYESFFAQQEGVPPPAKSWDVARRASMRHQRVSTASKGRRFLYK